MPRSSQPRKKASIPDSLHRQLNMYALAASAAGVSVLALAGASEAKVVYTETHQVTHTGYPLYIDLNHDGINDFQLRSTLLRSSGEFEVGLDAAGFRNNGNMVAGRRLSYGSGYFLSAASALPAGAEIGPKGNFSVRSPFMAAEVFAKDAGSQYSDLGPWANKGKGVSNRYLGLKFIVNGEVHYGWARLNVTLGHRRQFGDVSGTLTGYAYETVPNKPIIAGDTSGAGDGDTNGTTDDQSLAEPISGFSRQPPEPVTSLGTLALGAPGRAVGRRPNP